MNDRIWFRVPAATLFGSVVTAAVFLMIQGLIAPGELAIDEPPSGAVLTFVPEIEPTPPDVRQRKPVKPDDPVVPPDTEVPPPIGPQTATRFGTEVLPPDDDLPVVPKIAALTDGDALPIVKVQPVYPRAALSRNVEGYVLVEFTIDPLGRVADVRVVEASPPGVFDRAALQAVERFRYRPRVVNGEAVPVSGVRHVLTFEIEAG